MENRRRFTSDDVDHLSKNLYMRYLNPSKKVGHAVIMKDREGKREFLQYHIPQGSAGTPEFLPLKDIEEIVRNGQIRYRALTLDNIPMFASRFIDGDVDDKPFQIACFSPRGKRKKPFWGDESVPPLFQPNNTGDGKWEADEEHIDVQQQALSQPVLYKGGRTLEIEPESVREREAIIKRIPDQNTVMGQSAKITYEFFRLSWGVELPVAMKTIIDHAIDADFEDHFEGFYRPEWVHAEPFVLTPMSIDPQRKDNLGAAPKWANVEMMVLTHVVMWFALNCPAAVEKIKTHFRMLLNSVLIEKINYLVSIEDHGHQVRLFQRFSPFKTDPVFRKPTDLTQATAVVHSMLNGIPPVSTLSLFTKKRPLSTSGEVEQSESKHARIEPN